MCQPKVPDIDMTPPAPPPPPPAKRLQGGPENDRVGRRDKRNNNRDKLRVQRK